MRFVDSAKITIRSGKGGDGAATFRREKYVEFGGPDGGNGGRGGDIYAVADKSLTTLLDYRYKRLFCAKDGRPGRKRFCNGKAGEPLMMHVPLGTQIWDEDKQLLIADLSHDGEQVLLAQGGKGGCGNSYFKSSTNRRPTTFAPGESGQELTLYLTLRVLADAGLIGKPNAGKSSFLRAISNSNTKVGDYQFTTLRPHLGVLTDTYREMVIADIPGLLAGASEGHGLGHKFLAHLERCSVLIYFFDGHTKMVAQDYKILAEELTCYNAAMNSKPAIMVINKIDLMSAEDIAHQKQALARVLEDYNVNAPIFTISCTACSEGVTELQGNINELVAMLLDYQQTLPSSIIDDQAYKDSSQDNYKDSSQDILAHHDTHGSISPYDNHGIISPYDNHGGIPHDNLIGLSGSSMRARGTEKYKNLSANNNLPDTSSQHSDQACGHTCDHTCNQPCDHTYNQPYSNSCGHSRAPSYNQSPDQAPNQGSQTLSKQTQRQWHPLSGYSNKDSH